jgi:hypothetical protein
MVNTRPSRANNALAYLADVPIPFPKHLDADVLGWDLVSSCPAYLSRGVVRFALLFLVFLTIALEVVRVLFSPLAVALTGRSRIAPPVLTNVFCYLFLMRCVPSLLLGALFLPVVSIPLAHVL